MAHFAELDQNNIVIAVHRVNNEVLNAANEEQSGIEFLIAWSGGKTNFIQTSYNHNFRKQYAGIGYRYDREKDVFIQPQPFPSWNLDENNDWQPPKAKPEGFYYWNENDLDWVEIDPQS